MMAHSMDDRDSPEKGFDSGKYVRYTPEQVEALERVYAECPKPSSLRRQQLIRECPILCNIEPRQIKVWFQNRRSKFKKQQQSFIKNCTCKLIVIKVWFFFFFGCLCLKTTCLTTLTNVFFGLSSLSCLSPWQVLSFWILRSMVYKKISKGISFTCLVKSWMTANQTVFFLWALKKNLIFFFAGEEYVGNYVIFYLFFMSFILVWF